MAHFGFTLSWDAKKYKPHLIAALHPCKLGRLDFQQNLKVVSGTLFWGIWFPDLITTTLRVTDQRLARYKWARKIHLYTPTWLQKLHRPKIHMPKNPKHELSKNKNSSKGPRSSKIAFQYRTSSKASGSSSCAELEEPQCFTPTVSCGELIFPRFLFGGGRKSGGLSLALLLEKMG